MEQFSGFSPHRNFAMNLLALVNRKSSIAAVCRELEMNRQQFNKYLSGNALPSPPTLDRICRYFKVDPETMFHNPPAFRGRPPLPEPEAGQVGLPSDLLKSIGQIGAAMKGADMLEGCYLLYYPWPRDMTYCARSAMIVRRIEGFTRFSRFTRFRVLGSGQRCFLHGRHDGLVLQSAGSRYFVAHNRKGYGELSLLVFGPASAAYRDFTSGLALVTGPAADPVSFRVILEYRGPTGRALARKTIGQAGILPWADSSVAPQIRETIMPGNAPDYITPFSSVDSFAPSSPMPRQ
jgi:transcriptional regulator with XRE-family HTH domain